MNLQLITLFFLHFSIAYATQRDVYIVYLGGHNGTRTANEIEESHHTFVSSVKNTTEEAKSSIIHSYQKVINGFSVLLTSDEASKLSEKDGVISVFKSEVRKMATTRSWEFIDELSSEDDDQEEFGRQELLQQTNNGQDIIIGVIDSGVWPESKSFNDDGMDPIPERWKGTCEAGDKFDTSHCNRKLIGARSHLQAFESQYEQVNQNLDYRSPRDSAGHGTHTASTAGGRRVPDVSFRGGLARGVLSGGAPQARIAVYKACWQVDHGYFKDFECFDADMLSAFDSAIADGVDVLTISIYSHKVGSYLKDGVALGSWHAFKNNILVVMCAGNDGPNPSTVKNIAPWILTVGASSIDRSFDSPVILGNGTTVEGQGLSSTKMNKLYPLVFAGDVEIPGSTDRTTTGYCNLGTLDPLKVQGKIVLCLSTENYFLRAKALVVKEAGGIGVIIQSSYRGMMGIPAEPFLIPGTTVSYHGAHDILEYIRNNQYPTAMVAPAKTTINTKPAPVVAGFSSVGPNSFDAEILKPDIIAPGVSILSSWTEGGGPTDLYADNQVVKYNIEYGTSMSTPHVAAAAALIKAAHPEWSPSAIRSALMTTARQKDNTGQLIKNQFGNEATPFEMGAGFIRPTKAINPGLVYDAGVPDYLWLLCKSGDDVDQVDDGEQCPSYYGDPSRFANYPSVSVHNMKPGTASAVPRTVTNVGDEISIYESYVKTPQGFEVYLDPPSLVFDPDTKTRQFHVHITRVSGQPGDVAFGWYEWRDNSHTVKSPIVAS
ncbi:OLC1v1022078C1 [Oldenlandia corymbosa var. corymbosa]|uniref:OLC1v1022078C1 n=1 Tax=Oldenlandia corymbosa var. corymbosa TaxID=529605 RepID=A0AAV1BX28_OLDCO|nr:OLC1v1022078C1 [Oldenlandia corymbosa var. corymbosa]